MPHKYGRLPAKRFIGHPMLTHHVINLPHAPVHFDNGAAAGYELDGNGPDPSVTNQGPDFEGVGNCGVVGVVNGERTTQAVARTSISMPSANEAVAEYLGYTKGQDTGVVLVDLLEHWRTVGLFGRKILAWATIEVTDPRFYDYVYAFDWSYTGIAVDQAFEDQFADNQPFSYDPWSPLLGGHCVDVVGRPKLATWGRDCEYEESWRTRRMEEAHIVITPEDAEAKTDGVVNLETLVSDLDQLRTAA